MDDDVIIVYGTRINGIDPGSFEGQWLEEFFENAFQTSINDALANAFNGQGPGDAAGSGTAPIFSGVEEEGLDVEINEDGDFEVTAEADGFFDANGDDMFTDGEQIVLEGETYVLEGDLNSIYYILTWEAF